MTTRLWRRVCIAVAIAGITLVYAAGLRAVWSGDWVLGLGDCTVRAFTALNAPGEIHDLWSSIGLRSPWLRRHRLFVGAVARWIAGGGDSFWAVHWYQTLSLSAYLGGIVLFAAAARRLYGGLSAMIAVLLFFGFRAGLAEAADGMTEVYVLLLTGASTLALTESVASRRAWLLYAGAVANLAASTMRTEVILVAFMQWLALVGRTRSVHLLAFGFLSAAYFLARLVYSVAIYAGPVTFLNSNRTFFLPDAEAKYGAMLRHFMGAWGEPTAILVAFAAMVAMSRFYQSRFGAGGAEGVRQRPHSASRTRCAAGAWLAIREFATSMVVLPHRCLGVLVVFMVIGLRSGNLEPLPRYLMAPMPWFCLVGASLFAGGAARGTRAFRIAAATAALLLAIAAARSVGSVWTRRERFAADEIRLIEWLRSRPDAGAVFDQMDFRDGRCIVYAQEPGSPLRFLARGSPNPFRLAPGASTAGDDDAVEGRKRRSRLLAHATLLDSRCRYLVVPRHPKGGHSRSQPRNRSKPASYFEGDIEERGDAIRFRSSLLPDAPALDLRPVYSDRFVSVFEKIDDPHGGAAARGGQAIPENQ